MKLLTTITLALALFVPAYAVGPTEDQIKDAVYATKLWLAHNLGDVDSYKEGRSIVWIRAAGAVADPKWVGQLAIVHEFRYRNTSGGIEKASVFASGTSPEAFTFYFFTGVPLDHINTKPDYLAVRLDAELNKTPVLDLTIVNKPEPTLGGKPVTK